MGQKFIKLEVKGLEEYIRNIEAAGKNIDTVIADAVLQSAAPVHNDISAWVNKHTDTGAVAAGLMDPAVTKDGNEIAVHLGINSKGESWHSVFVEYGSPRNRPADPGIRTAFESRLSDVKKIQRRVLKEAGVPVDG
jgi:HK97 gp10 family phage protein